MELYAGLDVSLEETSVCVLNTAGKVVWQGNICPPLILFLSFTQIFAM